MDVLSLLFCTLATERRAELKIWRCVALAAVLFVIIGAGAELVTLWLGFAAGLCLRGRARAGAKAIRKIWRVTCSYTRRAIGRVWQAKLFDLTAVFMVRLITRRRIFLALRALAFYQPHFGIPLTASPPAR